MLEKVLISMVFEDFGPDRMQKDVGGHKWQEVIHANVNPLNIFIREYEVEVGKLHSLVLGDFGSAFLGPGYDRGGGMPNFHGPEWPYVSAKTDVWGLGAIIRELAHGWDPLESFPEPAHGWDPWESFPEPANKESKQAKPLDSKDYSEELTFCTMQCMEPDVDARIDSQDLVRLLSKKRAIWRENQKGGEQREKKEAREHQHGKSGPSKGKGKQSS